MLLGMYYSTPYIVAVTFKTVPNSDDSDAF